MSRGFGALTRPLLLLAGSLGWLAYLVRLQRRSLHMLQLESYQTARLLRWWGRSPTRLTDVPRLAASLIGLALGGLALLRRPWLALPALLAWSAVGAWLARTTAFPAARKPLVMTARARRLAGGQILVGLAAFAAARLGLRWSRGGQPAGAAGPDALQLATVLLPLSGLMAPLATAGANLLLYPLEAAIRRFYLWDAAAKLRRLNPVVVAVAGSYGKTSTKEFIATILEARFDVLRPPGSHNTPMGLTRLIREQLQPRHEVFVAELGDWVPGDIAFLCRLLRPRLGVLTAIGPEHLERFKTMDRVIASKFELLEALPAGGTAIVNQDDPELRRLGDRTPAAAVLRYGLTADGAQIRAREVRTTREGLEFVVEADGHGQTQFTVSVLGKHNVANLLAATAAALALGMSLEEIARAARQIKPVEHRLQPIQGDGGVLIIDDAFNSNPTGAAAALEVLAELEGGKRVLVTPGMVELAEREFEENRRFARQAATVCDEVVVVGQARAAPLVAGLRDAAFPAERLHVVSDLAAASALLGRLVSAGDVVLFENDLPDTYADPLSAYADSPGPAAVNGLAAPKRQLPRSFLELGNGLPRLAYRELGPPDAPAVVLLHGWGADLEAMARIQESLAQEWRVLAFDLPGFGQSEPPPTPWGTEDFARVIRAALERLGLSQVSLIGHSRGGATALVLAARWPELVERLVLVNSAGLRPARSLAYRARVAAFKLARRAAGRGPLADWLAARFGSADYRAAGPLRATLVRVVNDDLRSILPRVSAPTLLIWGDQDRETPLSDAAIMEREDPDAGLVVLPGAGHFSYADDLPRFCRIVGHFLKT